MFEFFKNFLNRFKKKELAQLNSGEAAKERLNLVLMQDRANVSADYIDLMRQDIIDDIKKYIDIDEKEIDLKLTNQIKNDGSNGLPALYANIPINRIKNEKKVKDTLIEPSLDTAEYKEIKKTIVNIAEKKNKAVKKEKIDTEVAKVVKKAESTKVEKAKTDTDKKATDAKKKATAKVADKAQSKKKAELKSEEIAESKAKTKVTKKESTNNK